MNKLWENAKDNLSFLLVCVLVFAAIFLLAKLFEKFAVHGQRKAQGARYVAYVGMFSAIAGVLMLLEIPLFFAPSFYKMDLSELPVLLCAFYLGPVSGVTAEFIKVCIKLLLKGTTTAFVGDFANFVVGCMFVLPASAIYHAHKSKRNSIIGMIVGTLCMTVVGSIFNAYYLIPKFAQLFGMPIDVIVSMGTAVNQRIVSVPTLVLYAVVPFNLLKGAVDSLLTFLLYKRLEKLFFKE
ncbi:MAG: ECF transporter S component [Oscillospiraceae bacterium]|nr:ECF transporter S component [Oscillospiraceae bacterium]MBR6209002.1 ECF transporter S component [Oscillospiraceae bacterium]